jgi:hypothetical protein
MKAGSEYMRPMSRNWEAVSDQVLRDRKTLDEWDRATKHGDRRAGPYLLPTPPPVLWKHVDTAPPAKPLELEPLHDGSTWDPEMIARAAEHVGPEGKGGLFVLLNVMARETFLGVTRFDGEHGRARMLQELSRDPADTLELAQAYLNRLPADLAQQIGRFKRSPEVIRLLAGEERRRSGGWFTRTGSGP